MAHDWPGNLREVSNVATRYVLGLPGARLLPGSPAAEAPAALNDQLDQFERALIADALRRHGGDVTASAKALGLPKQTLYDRMRRLHLSGGEFKGG